MKKTIKLAVVAALALGTTSAFATNGSTMIATGAKSMGMAGTGIGMSHGAESALVNPALITSVEGTEVEFGGTLFMPKVENTQSVYTTPPTTYTATSKSDANMNMIPEVSLASKVSDNLYVGVGMWGTAGMGTDYRTATTGTQFQMVTNLQLMQFGVPVAYKVAGLSLAVTPILQYGSLDINYVSQAGTVGAGAAQDLQFGYNLGAAYEISGLTVGATYKSQIDMKYKGQLTGAMTGFGVPYANDKLSTPAEMGVGISYKMGESTLAVDYKKIQWSKAKGYEDFKWDDQNVISVGYQYETKDWAARVGYNYSKSPISEQAARSMGTFMGGQGDFAGLINTFNLLGFPAIVQSHVSVGGTYNVSKTTSFDVAYTYTPEVSNTYKNFQGLDVTTKHSQTGVSGQVCFKF